MTPLQATAPQLSPPFVRGVATFRRLRLQAALAVCLLPSYSPFWTQPHLLHLSSPSYPKIPSSAPGSAACRSYTLLKTRKLDAGASVTRDEFRTPEIQTLALTHGSPVDGLRDNPTTANYLFRRACHGARI